MLIVSCVSKRAKAVSWPVQIKTSLESSICIVTVVVGQWLAKLNIKLVFTSCDKIQTLSTFTLKLFSCVMISEATGCNLHMELLVTQCQYLACESGC